MDIYIWSLLCHHCVHTLLSQLSDLVFSRPWDDHLHCLVLDHCSPSSWPGRKYIRKFVFIYIIVLYSGIVLIIWRLTIVAEVLTKLADTTFLTNCFCSKKKFFQFCSEQVVNMFLEVATSSTLFWVFLPAIKFELV